MTAIGILIALVGFGLILGFVAGRISTAPDELSYTFPDVTDAQLAQMAHEATRAFYASKGDFSVKSWNNTSALSRESLIRRVKSFREKPLLPNGNDPFAMHLQAAIVSLGRVNR